jgi:sporulation protein YlmC with PRC-barrel domain
MEFAGTKQRQAKTFQDETVFAHDGEKVGKVEKVLFDKATRKPEWLAVQTGLFGIRSRIVPFQGAARTGDGVSVPYPASRVQSAPELEGDEISQDLERQLAQHYQLAYSESRSPTGLAEGQRAAPAPGRSSRSRNRSRSGRKGSTNRTSRSSTRRSQGPTRDELYAQAKRLGIEGRSKMTKAQLERAVSRQKGRKTSGGKQKANPFEVQEFLQAVGYPAGKRELVREAKEQGAGARVRSTLERLPDKEFGTPAEVSEAIGTLS